MLSDVSSLTDLSSDEDESFAPNSKAKKPAKTAEYTLKGSLKAPRTVQFSAKHLYGMSVQENFRVRKRDTRLRCA